MKIHKEDIKNLYRKNKDIPFLTYCRKLIKDDNDPNDSAEMYRNGILSLFTKNIGEAAKLTVKEKFGTCFTKYKDPSAYFNSNKGVAFTSRIAFTTTT